MSIDGSNYQRKSIAGGSAAGVRADRRKIAILFTANQFDNIKALGRSRGTSFAEAARYLIERGLEVEVGR